MRFLTTLQATALSAAPAAAHLGMGENAAHDTMHAVGGVELLLAILGVGLGLYFGNRRLRSRSIGRK